MHHQPTPILALDPGIRDLGFAVLRGRRILASGVSSFRFFPQEERLAEARRVIRHWVRTYRPGAVVLEQTHRHPTPSLNDLYRLGRSVERFAKQQQLPVETYAAQTVRKQLVGNGWATKREVATAIASRFPALRVYLTQDRRWKERYWQNMFDAVALALYYQGQPPSRSRPYG
jgi:Holliday junction resolvasome RuvABC endonuclease subunit